MCPLKVDLLSVTFDPETAEIRSVIVTHAPKLLSRRTITAPGPSCSMGAQEKAGCPTL